MLRLVAPALATAASSRPRTKGADANGRGVRGVRTSLSACCVRVAWQDGQAAASRTEERIRADRALQVNVGVLAFLLAFSWWNQLNDLSDTWTPPHTALALPGWTAYVVRAPVVPMAFMAAAFLAPLAEPIAAQIEGEARATLADVFKIARRQCRKMLREAEESGRDMTGALALIVTDGELRAPGKPPTGPGHAATHCRTPRLRQRRYSAIFRGRSVTPRRKPKGGANTRGVRTDSVEN